MPKARYERCKFDQQEDQLLLHIVSHEEKISKRICYKKIAILFNKLNKSSPKPYKKRKGQILKERFHLLQGGHQKQWTFQHQIKMLELVSAGASWAQIAKFQAFRACNFNNNFIKKQFETCQRMKYRALSSYFLNSFSKQISDRTLQTIIRPKELQLLLDKKIVNLEEYSNLIQHQDFFMASRMNQNNVKVCLRKKAAKQRVFLSYGILQKNIGKKLAESISKIDSYMKNEYFQEEVVINQALSGKKNNMEAKVENGVKKEEEVAKEEKKQNEENGAENTVSCCFSLIHLESEDQYLDRCLDDILKIR